MRWICNTVLSVGKDTPPRLLHCGRETRLPLSFPLPIFAHFGVQVPFLIVALVPISGMAFVLGTRYLNASRELKRLDSVSKSPIYAHFSESVNGVSTM